MNMNDYPAGPHRWAAPTSEQRIAALEAHIAELEVALRVMIDEAENMANDYHPRYARVDEAIESARAALAKGK